MASSGGASPGPGAGPAPPPPPPVALQQRSFKLRFAAQREPGRSDVSPVKPLGLPSTVTGKFYVRERASVVDEAAERALVRIRAMFSRAPADKYERPVTSAHEYGWYEPARAARDGRLQHHLRDSAWLKARLLVLAADDKLKHK